MDVDQIFKNISFTDILKHTEYGIVQEQRSFRNGRKAMVHYLVKGGKKLTLKEFNNFFYQLGLDTNRDKVIVSEPGLHHTLLGRRVYGKYFTCRERCDKEWLKSGMASEEIRIACSGMRDMTYVLKQLETGNSDGY